jgi:drug/metabolite transporter (DMT)-like permease
MTCVGGSVAVSGVLADAPLFTAQAVRYAVACLLLLLLARLTGRRIEVPRGTEWCWLLGVAATGQVLFNVALIRGSAHAEPAVLGVAVACAPVVLAVVGPLLDGTRPARPAVSAAAVVTAGAMLVQGGGRSDLAGVGWAAVVLLCEVGFTLLAVPVLRRHGPWGVSVHTCGLAGALLAVLGLVTEGPAAVSALRAPHLLAVA